MTGFSRIETAPARSCAIGFDNQAYCWGSSGNSGLLGDGQVFTLKATPVKVNLPPGVTGVLKISLGHSHACLIGSDSKTYCWGANDNGQIPGYTNPPYVYHNPSLFQIALPPGVSGFSQILSGISTSCGITASADIYCWGDGTYGQIGNGRFDRISLPAKVALPSNLTNYSQLAVGYFHSCVLGADQRTHCWGYNYFGELGDGSTTHQALPVATLPGYMSTVKSVTFDGIPGTNLLSNSNNELWVDYPAHAPGKVDVTIIGIDGRKTTLPSQFTYLANGIVHIPDENLRRAINRTLSKGDVADGILLSEMKSLTYLYADSYSDTGKIKDLTGLETAVNLNSLSLNNHEITDVSPLNDLTKLGFLRLSGNQISDLAPLSKLNQLSSLELSKNQIVDLVPLGDLIKLNRLTLDNNQISDIAPLSTLTGLDSIDLQNNQIADLSPLASVASLRGLDASKNQISDLTPLSSLTNLNTITLYSNKISDMTSLGSLTNLYNLQLDDNQISNLPDLTSLTNLGTITLSNNQISDVSNLAKITSLNSINIMSNQISDISSLAALPWLYDLKYLYNFVTDMSAFKDNSRLNAQILQQSYQVIKITPDSDGNFTTQWTDYNDVTHRAELSTDSYFQDATGMISYLSKVRLKADKDRTFDYLANLAVPSQHASQLVNEPIIQANEDGSYTFLRHPSNLATFSFAVDSQTGKAITDKTGDELARSFSQGVDTPVFLVFDFSSFPPFEPPIESTPSENTPTDQDRTTAQTPGTGVGGGLTWLFVAGAVLAGLGIGVLIAMLIKRRAKSSNSN